MQWCCSNASIKGSSFSLVPLKCVVKRNHPRTCFRIFSFSGNRKGFRDPSVELFLGISYGGSFFLVSKVPRQCLILKGFLNGKPGLQPRIVVPRHSANRGASASLWENSNNVGENPVFPLQSTSFQSRASRKLERKVGAWDSTQVFLPLSKKCGYSKYTPSQLIGPSFPICFLKNSISNRSTGSINWEGSVK